MKFLELRSKRIPYNFGILPVHALTFSFAILIFLLGALASDNGIMLVAVFGLFGSNVYFAVKELKSRILFFLLHCGFFLFILSRPLFSYILPNQTWRFPNPGTTYFILLLIFISLSGLFLGAVFFEAICHYNQYGKQRYRILATPKAVADDAKDLEKILSDAKIRHWISAFSAPERLKALRYTSLVIFVVSLLGTYAIGLWTLKIMAGRDYTEYYLIDFSKEIPWALSLMPSILPYVLSFFLATIPNKKESILVLFAYSTSTIPLLMIGKRAEVVLSFVFIVFYVLMRHVMHKEEKWITRKEIIFTAIFVPPFMVAMGLINYLRAGTQGAFSNPFLIVADALYKQGVSFKVLGYAYEVMPQIHSLGAKYFTVGNFISTIHDGFIGRIIFGLTPLPSVNSKELALHGHSFAHTMSYFAHSNYLNGEGYGSSFMLELYADFGLWGVCVGSFVIGAALIGLMRLYGLSWFVTFQPIFLISQIFYLPRSSVADLFLHLYNTRFCALVILLIVVALFIEWTEVSYLAQRKISLSSIPYPKRRNAILSDLDRKVIRRDLDV